MPLTGFLRAAVLGITLLGLTACSDQSKEPGGSTAGGQGRYEGKDTLADYPNPRTLESEAAKDIMLDLIDFWEEDKNTQLVTVEQMMGITLFLYLGLHSDWVHDVDPRSMNMRPTGPFIDGVGYNTHQRAQVFYSNEVVDWLLNDRQGDIPDGAMIVKQMYTTDPADTSYGGDKVTGWAVMIRDNKATVDGWLWFLFFFPGTPSYGDIVLLGQYGMSFCLSCHSGADNTQNTYSYIGNINGEDPTRYTNIVNPTALTRQGAQMIAGHGNRRSPINMDEGALEKLLKAIEGDRDSKDVEKLKEYAGLVKDMLSKPSNLDNDFQESMSQPVTKPLTKPNPAIVATFGERTPETKEVVPIPWDLFTGHTVVSPTDPKLFVSSDNCRGCHDASLLLGGRQPEMMLYQHKGTKKDDSNISKINLSVYGEWGSSMMGLAGRDPIFHAQLESEQALRPEIADWTADLCLSCHQVAGQRQFHLDGQSGDYYTADYTYIQPQGTKLNEKAVYGSLGRDGVTCTVCHQITPEGLGEPETFTGQFKVNDKAGKFYGPFPDAEIKPYYMQQALNIEPVHGEQITDSGLCGSCHTINLPVLPANASSHEPPEGKIAHEQTTYLEWLNSDYTDDPDETCQGCHMPNKFREVEPLNFRIANVEDADFPFVDNRADDDKITLDHKKGYRRHTLVGLNVFANRMFQQFPVELGYTTLDPGTPLTYGDSAKGAMHRLTLTEMEMHEMAADTADLEATVSDRGSDTWTVDVTLRNKAGHKFPTGVGFRRAFLEVTALDASGNVLWGSGRTNGAGVIVDGKNEPLPSEMTRNWKELQPNYSEISREDQAMVFETRHINMEGELTTSFLGLDKEIKDNRLLPAGWKPDGRYADQTELSTLGVETFNPETPGTRAVRYRIPTSVGAIDRVNVRLMYQSIPPYYLRDRFATKGKENDRLYHLVSRLNLKHSARNWSLKVAQTEAR